MRNTRALAFVTTLVAAALAGAFPLACSASHGASTTASTHGTGAATSGTGGSSSGGSQGAGGNLFGDGGLNDPVVSLSISPTNPVIEVLDGAIPAPTTFVANGTTKSGATVQVPGMWAYDRIDVGTMNAGTGDLTATGLVGGKGTVTFTPQGLNLSATTSATVKLHFTSNPQMVSSSTMGMFGQTSTPDPVLNVLYPYDKTVFPRGLTGPVLQWNGGAATDLYYVHAVSPTFEFEAWGTVPPPSQYTFPSMTTDVWKKLTDSTTGDITVTIQRNDGAQAFLQAPAGVSCIACHSVSKDGSTLVASFNGGQSPWGTFDAASGSSIFNSGQNSGLQAISPDGKFVLWGTWDDGSFNSAGQLTLTSQSSVTPLAQLNPGGGAPAHPAWSGDGKNVAFAVRTDGNGLDFNTSTLWTTSVDLGSSTFSNTHKIVDSGSPQTATVYPTYSPDSQWIAFERCTHSRSRANLGDVWIVQADGSNGVPLDNANGKGLLTGAEISSTYEPTFMPVAVGGYYWLIVVSERTYGNTLTDVNPSTRHKQLWVTAVDASPMPGQDPSHPAFWLPGQETANNNMRGEWALSPCKMLGDVCTAGYDCCGGFCKDNGMGMLTCSNTAGMCSQLGDKCTTAADCCDPNAMCVGGFCSGKMTQ